MKKACIMLYGTGWVRTQDLGIPSWALWPLLYLPDVMASHQVEEDQMEKTWLIFFGFCLFSFPSSPCPSVRVSTTIGISAPRGPANLAPLATTANPCLCACGRAWRKRILVQCQCLIVQTKHFFSEEQQLFSDDRQFFSEGSETATILRRMATF